MAGASPSSAALLRDRAPGWECRSGLVVVWESVTVSEADAGSSSARSSEIKEHRITYNARAVSGPLVFIIE